jgi:hypothetical protein
MKITSISSVYSHQVYIISYFEADITVLLEHGEFDQTSAAAWAAHTGSAGGCVACPMRGTQEIFAKRVEKVTRIPIKF